MAGIVLRMRTIRSIVAQRAARSGPSALIRAPALSCYIDASAKMSKRINLFVCVILPLLCPVLCYLADAAMLSRRSK